jgi:hypothetical protein
MGKGDNKEWKRRGRPQGMESIPAGRPQGLGSASGGDDEGWN